MNFIINNTKWLMLISGVLTATMFYGVFSPQFILESMFGAVFEGDLENIVIRSWSALIGLIGLMLVYGFFKEKYRAFTLFIAAFSKLVFIALVFMYGQAYLATVMSAIIMDSVVVLVSLSYFGALKYSK